MSIYLNNIVCLHLYPYFYSSWRTQKQSVQSLKLKVWAKPESSLTLAQIPKSMLSQAQARLWFKICLWSKLSLESLTWQANSLSRLEQLGTLWLSENKVQQKKDTNDVYTHYFRESVKNWKDFSNTIKLGVNMFYIDSIITYLYLSQETYKSQVLVRVYYT